jgi:hypothetical protein
MGNRQVEKYNTANGTVADPCQWEEDIFMDDVSDDALEISSGTSVGNPTLIYGSYCLTCPSGTL